MLNEVEPRLLKAAEARRILGVCYATFRKLVDAGTIKPRRLKGIPVPRYNRDEILKLCS